MRDENYRRNVGRIAALFTVLFAIVPTLVVLVLASVFAPSYATPLTAVTAIVAALYLTYRRQVIHKRNAPRP